MTRTEYEEERVKKAYLKKRHVQDKIEATFDLFKKLIIVLIIISIVTVCIMTLINDNNKAVKDWNHGYCSECGDKYYYSEHFESGDGIIYVCYECPHCHHCGDVNENLIEDDLK